MKKKYLLSMIFAGLFFAGSAFATPFQIGTGGTLNVKTFGLGAYKYEALASDLVELAEGETSDLISLFKVEISAFAVGAVEAIIQLTDPVADGVVVDSGSFKALGHISDEDFSVGFLKLKWGDPIHFGYSYNGASGGIFTLDLLDIKKMYLGPDAGPVFVKGYLTNVQDPQNPQNPVPEPVTMLLFGIGLASFAGYRRRIRK